ncbi:MAG: GNAT family N-acetyltransferase [Rubrobacteraceae bacterium]
MLVEKATGEDLARIRSLDSTVIGDSSRRELLAGAVCRNQCWTAKAGGFVVGFAILERSFYNQAFISLVVVDPAYRRRGAATALIRRIEATCSGEKLFTSTNRSNAAMQRVLEKLGFERSGYIENLDEGDPELVYFKKPG